MTFSEKGTQRKEAKGAAAQEVPAHASFGKPLQAFADERPTVEKDDVDQ